MGTPLYPRRRLAPSRLILWLCGIAFSSLLSAQVPGARQVDPRQPVTRAYSPFDEKTPARSLSPDQYDKARVLIKLKPEALAVASGPTKMSGATFGVAGLGEVKRVFPTAQAPVQKASSAAAGEPPPPDLRLWQQAEVTSGAEVLRLIDELKKSSLVATAEADVLYRLSDEGIVSPLSSSASPTQLATSGEPQRASAAAIPDGSKDPLMASQWHLDAAKVKEAWANLAGRNLPPGGNRDIVIAVIDSGVDYTHPDLAPNMWVNSREIPGNGIDDDGNGIVDDVYGASFIGSSFDHKGNPMDDHGHGTHVAGIIAAAANNGVGGVGIAYNCRIMAIKAAQYSGVLSSTDISEAIIYAVEKGADIINMSFGGSAQSKLVEDALAVAFGQAVLVASAGNAGKHCEAPPISPVPAPMFPAAYIYVLGTMAQQQAANAKGEWLAGFSNWDSVPNSRIEYELMAPGVAIPSTLPGNQYTAWSGTSMAAPVVSGIAALVRTRFPDKNVYSSRFIMGQIAATGSKLVGVVPGGKAPADFPSPISYYSADALKAVSRTPEPDLKLLDYWIFDQPSIAAGNDGDGIIDAGETIDLAIVIKNRWGKADQVSVKLSAEVEGAVGPAPYITWITDTVDYGAVGNFGEDDNGLIYNADGLINGVRFPFRFKVATDCPNDFIIPFKVTMTCRNGLDANDPKASYTFTDSFSCVVQKGRVLPTIIQNNLTMGPETYWIIDGPVLIPAGIKVAVLPGTQIQFWSADTKETYAVKPQPFLQVDGELLLEGSPDRPIELFPSGLHPNFPVSIVEQGVGKAVLRYFKLANPRVGGLQAGGAGNAIITEVSHGLVTQNGELSLPTESIVVPFIDARTMRFVRFYRMGVSRYHTDNFTNTNATLGALPLSSKREYCLFDSSRVAIDSWIHYVFPETYSDDCFIRTSVFLNNFTTNAAGVPQKSLFVGFSGTSPKYTGLTYGKNAILNQWWRPDPRYWMLFTTMAGSASTYSWSNNYWGGAPKALAEKAIIDKDINFALADITIDPLLEAPPVDCWPFVVDCALTNNAGRRVFKLGAEPVTFTVTFNRDMSTAKAPRVSFGPDTPLTDYTVHAIGGGWVNPRTWKGTFNVNTITGDGYQLIRISDAVAADDPWLVNGNDEGRFRFEIVTSGVESLNLQAAGGEKRVDLSWTQTDFELLAGYNLYRSTSETGTYSRVNAAIIPAQNKQFTDLNVSPGQPYFYKFTVVQTDMSESQPSNIATGTPLDTIPPIINHTAISAAKPGLQVDLAADITDNVRVTGATLYHRTRGETTYQTRSLVNTAGSRWTVTLESSRIISPGVEYYISATDGVLTTLSGRPDAPYFIKVEDSPVVTGVSPVQGTIAGGAVVTIAGSNFKTGAKVLFGSTPATDVVVVSATQITCKAPSNIPAKVSVTVEAADGSRSTLANAFTFLDPNPSLYLPDRSSFTGAIITVPLDIANSTGLVAADITVTYASAVLKLRGATAGSLASGWTLLPNTSTTGEVRLSMASGGGAVSGTGTLANLEFEVLGQSGQTSALTITAARLNDGAVTATRIAGSVAVSVGYVISGRVGYWADTSRVVTGTTLTLEGAGTVTTTNGSDGTYRFENLQNIAYSVTPAKTTQVEAITAYDAALALRHAVGLTTLTGNAAKAADVNLSGEITSMDAYHILRQSAQLEPISVAGAGRAWYFTPDKLTFPALSGSQTGQNFTAILLGDISGNWMSTTGQAGGATVRTGLATVVDSVANRTVVSLLLQAGSVPVRGIDAVLTYATGQSLVGVEVEPELVNSVNGTAAGTVRAALANAEGISGDRVLLALTFSGTTNPQVAIQSLMLDEGAILSAGDADPALFDRNGDGRIDAPGLPRITRQPQAQTLSTGGTDVTFSVSATGSPAPVFQWYRNGVAIANATNTSLTISGVQAAATGLYTVKVSNSAGVVTSTAAALSISQPGNNATHALTGPGYVAGQTLTIANTLTYGGSPSGLRWSVLLPPEWRFASSTAGGASRAPAVNDTGLIEWEWTTAIPASPLTFSYTLSVPSGQAGAKEIAALVGVRSGAETQVLAQPDPLPVAPVTTHSADTDRNYRISLTELTRVIELYNSRNGTTRTGAYGLAETTEDGFAADATRAASVAVSLGRYHTADYNRDAKLSLVELTRVIELYNTRTGTNRTGRYRAQAGTEDGFASEP